MRISRTVLVATAAWLAVVAVGSVLVWSVISRAGDVEPGSTVTVPSATSSGPPTPPPSSGGPDDGAERRTWQGPGGYVSAECRAAVISLVAAQADAGFVVEVDERGPVRVTVAFEGQGEEGRETEVRGECRSGVPDFEASTDG